MMLMADAPIAKVSHWLRCDEKSLVKILRYWVNKAVDGMNLADIAMIAIDETSFRRGHKYVTLVVDAIKRRVIDVEEGRDGGTVDLFAKKLVDKGGDTDNVRAVTSDMSRSFLPAIARNFPNAEHTIDKFHVKQILTTALDEVRKEEQKSADDKRRLFLGRRLFMIPQKKLNSEQADSICDMSKRYPKTGRAYRIVAALDDFYSCRSVSEAEASLQGLISWMRRCRLNPMKEASKSLINHKDKIVNFFRNRLTNAICEGINSMIQAAKRKARGFHTFEGFSSMIYLVAGKLDLDVPLPF